MSDYHPLLWLRSELWQHHLDLKQKERFQELLAHAAWIQVTLAHTMWMHHQVPLTQSSLHEGVTDSGVGSDTDSQ